MRLFRKLAGRAEYYRIILGRGRGVVALAWALLNALLAIRGELPDDVQQRWRILSIARSWPWEAWVLIGLAGVTAVVLEGGYRYALTLSRSVKELHSRLSEYIEKSDTQAQAERLLSLVKAAPKERFYSLQELVTQQGAGDGFPGGSVNWHWALLWLCEHGEIVIPPWRIEGAWRDTFGRGYPDDYRFELTPIAMTPGEDAELN